MIVPTHDRPESLRRCLASLGAGSAEFGLEIVVVDDGSRDGPGVAEVVRAVPGAKLIRQPRQGPAAARNTGLRTARGPVVCFIDDDCEAAADWARRLFTVLSAGADVAAGMTTDGNGASLCAAASQLQAAYFMQRSAVPFASTNNVAARAELLRALPFDESFRVAGEDREWCFRLAEHGYRITFEPSARIFHHQRLTLGGYVRQHVRYGRGAYRYHVGTPRRRPFEARDFYAGLLRRGFSRGLRIGALVVLGQAAVGLGFLTERTTARRQGHPSRRRTSLRSLREDRSRHERGS